MLRDEWLFNTGGIDLLRGSVPKCLVQTSLLVVSDILGKSCFQLPDGLIAFEVNILIFDRPSESLHKDMIQVTAFPVHANANACGLQLGNPGLTGILASLVGIGDLRSPYFSKASLSVSMQKPLSRLVESCQLNTYQHPVPYRPKGLRLWTNPELPPDRRIREQSESK